MAWRRDHDADCRAEDALARIAALYATERPKSAAGRRIYSGPPQDASVMDRTGDPGCRAGDEPRRKLLTPQAVDHPGWGGGLTSRRRRRSLQFPPSDLRELCSPWQAAGRTGWERAVGAWAELPLGKTEAPSAGLHFLPLFSRGLFRVFCASTVPLGAAR